MRTIKLFEQFSEEKTDNIQLRKVANYIEKRFKKRNNPIFVYWIAKIFNINDISFVSEIEMSENIKDVKHVFIRLENKFFDETGMWDKEDLMKEFDLTEYNFKDLVFDDGLDKLKDLVDKQDFKMSEKSLDEMKKMIEKIKNS
jgi:hypothetical protein